jgi:anti-anti-sigma factor
MHTLVLLGELDGASAATLEAAVEDLCETDVAQITLDLSKLTQIDATGVAVVAFRCRWCERHGHEVTLIAGSRQIQRAFELAGLGERLPFLAGADATEQDDELLVAASAHAPLDEQFAGEAPPRRRSRSITLLRGSGRHSRGRRARRARLAGGI